MIVNLKKYLFLGANEEIDQFFEQAQIEGFIEFIIPSSKKLAPMSQPMLNLLAALKILRSHPAKQPYVGWRDRSFVCQVAERIITVKDEIEKLQEEERLVEAEIIRVSPFGDFSIEDVNFIEHQGKRKIQFLCMKTGKRENIALPEEVIYINTDYDLDYFIAVNPLPVIYPNMIEMRIDRPVGELLKQLHQIKTSLHQLEEEIRESVAYSEMLHQMLIDELNTYHLSTAKAEAQLPLGGTLFAIEAWVPVNRLHAVFSMIETMTVHAEEIPVFPEDRVPTCMENKKTAKIGEELVHIYDIPAHTDKDPSSWVLWFFAFFFAMIVADGGYGLLYLALACFLYYRFPAIKGYGKRMLKLLTILATSCILWGVMTSSFFGLHLDPSGPFGKVSVLRYLAEKKADYHMHKQDDVYKDWVTRIPQLSEAKNGAEFLEKATIEKKGRINYLALDDFSDNILLEFSLLIGVIHISLGFLRYILRNLAGIGWISFMVGGYLYFPFLLNATSLVHYLNIIEKTTAQALGLQLIYVGIAAAILLALFQKRWQGLGEVTNVIGVFSDVLSYLRLYALGLAGSIMAATFNEMGMDAGLMLGVIIILAGHTVNILLGSMGGVIHGLRLNFLEWYHTCFEGGGRLFNPLRKLKR